MICGPSSVQNDNKFFFTLPGTSGAHLQYFNVLQGVLTSIWKAQETTKFDGNSVVKAVATVAQVCAVYCVQFFPILKQKLHYCVTLC